MKKYLLLILFFVCISTLAQTKVSGHVYDDANDPVPYVNIYFEGTSIGTSTDENGTYYIEDDETHETIVYSFVGFQTQKVKLTQKVNYKFNVVLKEDAASLD